jgi:hypothetical protein
MIKREDYDDDGGGGGVNGDRPAMVTSFVVTKQAE